MTLAETTNPVLDALETLEGQVLVYGGGLVAIAVATVGLLFGIRWIWRAIR